MKGQFCIQELWAFVVTDKDGTEGVFAFYRQGVWMPAVGADAARVKALREFVNEQLPALIETGVEKVVLCKFTEREEVEVIFRSADMRTSRKERL